MNATVAQHPLFDAPINAPINVPVAATSRTLRSAESPPKPVRESSAPWLDATPKSRARNSGVFLLVLFGHVAVFAILAAARSSPPPARLVPAQVVIVAEQQSTLELPKLPPPQFETPQFDVPLVPIVVESVVADNNAITVAQRPPEEAAAVANVGAPKEVSSVEYVREPAAKYPSAARALKQRGTVMLRALIDIEGRAREVKVHRSSGFKLLDDAARNAVFTALFKPYAENGRSIPVYVLIPIEFGSS